MVYRQMPAPRELPQQIPTPQAKARMQKPHGGGKFLVQISGGGWGVGGWLWQKLTAALLLRKAVKVTYLCVFVHVPNFGGCQGGGQGWR